VLTIRQTRGARFGQSVAVGNRLYGSTLEHATHDVRRTVEYLIDERDAAIIRVESPPGTPNGNVLIELRDRDVTVRISRDRGQWMLAVRVNGLPEWPLDLIYDAITDRDEWPAWTGPLPDQLPPDVSWFDWLPRAIDWLRSTPDAAAKLRQVGEVRASQIFG
jgi:hypothetical protein